MRVKCAACGQAANAAFEACEFCGATLVQETDETMARRAKPPEEKKAGLAQDREAPDPQQQKTIVVAAALGGFVLVLLVAGWIGSALVRGASKVGEHEEVQKLERDVNDAFKKVPKRR